MYKYLRFVPIVILSAAPALAASTPPLEPGKPAGVARAQLENSTGMLIVAGGAAIGIGVALATADNASSASPTTNATTTTSTTP